MAFLLAPAYSLPMVLLVAFCASVAKCWAYGLSVLHAVTFEGVIIFSAVATSGDFVISSVLAPVGSIYWVGLIGAAFISATYSTSSV